MLAASVYLRQRLSRSCYHWKANESYLDRWRYSTSVISSVDRCHSTSSVPSAEALDYNLSTVSPEKRQQDLLAAGFKDYPRAAKSLPTPIGEFRKWEGILNLGLQSQHPDPVTITGRIISKRTAGSNLLFIDIEDTPGNPKLQIVVDKAKLSENTTTAGNPVKRTGKLLQIGDTISVTGHPYSSDRGEFSLRAASIPNLLSPCLHQQPSCAAGAAADFAHDRHVQMRVDPAVVETIVMRSKIISAIRDFFLQQDFVEVQTPMLAASAGGAIARPFETKATEFLERKLALRIAPELWLKRLIIGGMQRIFELGQSFRNEGLDKTHNPEFTTTEFYAANWTLSKLRSESQALIENVAAVILKAQRDPTELTREIVAGADSWPVIDFILALNQALELQLPDLSAESAREEVLNLFKLKQLPVPSTPTLPRLMDKLCFIYIENRCHSPTWIINTPECLSPLAKSFPHPQLPNQRVAARAELFIRGKEVINCYEEENDPTEQRRKLIEQQRHACLNDNSIDLEAMQIDEDYLRALEWGLPPTGGWGCGIDRLCMLLLGKDKISDVLAFGSLRMVARGAQRWDKE